MKKAVIAAVLLGIFLILPYAYAVEPKEFISPNPPEKIVVLNASFPIAEAARVLISSKKDGKVDYGLIAYVDLLIYTLEVYMLEGRVSINAYSLFALTPKKDEKGNIMPDAYDAKLVADVWVDPPVAWYVSEEVKKIAQAAIRETQEVINKATK